MSEERYERVAVRRPGVGQAILITVCLLLPAWGAATVYEAYQPVFEANTAIRARSEGTADGQALANYLARHDVPGQIRFLGLAGAAIVWGIFGYRMYRYETAHRA